MPRPPSFSSLESSGFATQACKTCPNHAMAGHFLTNGIDPASHIAHDNRADNREPSAFQMELFSSHMRMCATRNRHADQVG